MDSLSSVLQASGLFTPVTALALTVPLLCSCKLLERVAILIISDPGPFLAFLELAFSSCLLYTPFWHTPCLLFLNVLPFVQLDACCVSVYFSVLCLASLTPLLISASTGHALKALLSIRESESLLGPFP